MRCGQGSADCQVESRIQRQRPQMQRLHHFVQAEESRGERRGLITECLEEAVPVGLSINAEDEGLSAVVGAAMGRIEDEAGDEVGSDDFVEEVDDENAVGDRKAAPSQVQPLPLN